MTSRISLLYSLLSEAQLDSVTPLPPALHCFILQQEAAVSSVYFKTQWVTSRNYIPDVRVFRYIWAWLLVSPSLCSSHFMYSIHSLYVLLPHVLLSIWLLALQMSKLNLSRSSFHETWICIKAYCITVSIGWQALTFFILSPLTQHQSALFLMNTKYSWSWPGDLFNCFFPCSFFLP